MIPGTMPSERAQRRIDSLLDDAEAAIASNDWGVVRERVQSVLALEPDNADAIFYREAADRASDGVAESSPISTKEAEGDDTPTSFANGRYKVTVLLHQ